MSSNDIITRLRVVGQAAYTGALDAAAASLGKVDTNAKGAQTSVDKAGDTAGKSGRNWKGAAFQLAKWAGGAAAVYKGAQYIKGAVSQTESFAKSTMALQRSTGLDVKTASQWAEVTKVRGIQTKQFQVGLVALSRQLEGARKGGKQATDVIRTLGISQATVNAGNVQQAILESADAFKNMTNPAQKAALAQKLFGKQGQALLPILNKGSDGVREQLGLAEKYGAVLTDKGAKSVAEMAAKQRELTMAQDGLKLQLGQALLPVMASVTQAIVKLVAVLNPLLRNSLAVKVALGFLVAAFTAYKIAVIASTIASMGMIAVWALIPLAIAAIVIGLIYAYKKVGWFRDAVNAAFNAVKTVVVGVFNWITGHWQLLASILGGPFVAAAILIVQNFGKIKQAASDVVRWVRDRFNSLKNLASGFVEVGKRVIQAIVEGIKSAPGAIVDAIESLLPGPAKKVLHALPGFATGGLMGHTGTALVGERGPELVRLPGGSRITPLAVGSGAPVPVLGTGTGAGTAQMVANIWLDRRMIATAVAEDTSDRKARR